MSTDHRIGNVVALQATCLIVAALCCCPTAAAADKQIASVELEPIPFPTPEELDELPPQLATMTALLGEMLEMPGLSRAELGAAYGDLGRLFHAHGLIQPAAGCYRHARRHAPDDHRWPYYLAMLQQQQGQMDAALASWANAISLRVTSAALFHMAEVLLAQGRIDEAAAVLGNAHRLDPSSTATAARLSQTLLVLGRGQEAARLLEQTLIMFPDEAALHTILAQLYLQLGDKERALRHKTGDTEEPMSLLDPLLAELAMLRNDMQRSMLVGRQALAAGLPAKAVQAFRNAAAAQPDRLEPRTALGQAMILAGDRPSAEAQLRRVLEMAPENAEANHLMGVLLIQEQQLGTALDHLLLAASLDSESAPLQLDLALALVASGKQEESLTHFAAAARLAPTQPKPWIGGSSALLALNRYAEAAKVLTSANANLPDHGGIATALARVLAGCPDLAVRDGNRALQLASDAFARAPTPYRAETMAMALAELGRCQEAATWQLRAIDAAKAAGQTEEAQAMEAILTLYQKQDPCRFPAGPSQKP